MRSFVQALFGVVVLSGAFLASSVWAPTAEAASTTWDCQSFEPPTAGSDTTRIAIAITNLRSGDAEGTVRLRKEDGEVVDSPEFDLDPGEGTTFTFNTQNAYRASITADTEKLIVTAAIFHYDSTDLLARGDVPCTMR